ncbi:DotU family type IV/VI secretion system protein [Alphaproteobacteria bacterium]|nr:DotU family type IV/VI secretion system protein [Alphaproteobacteria bacterium]
MSGQVAETSFVIRFMEEFYERVADFKQKVQNRQWITPKEGLTSTPDDIAKRILDELGRILKHQALEAPRHGGEFASDFYREAQFVMAALADEVFLGMKWDGRTYWEDHLLESQLFGSHTAGEVFFSRLERFLQERDSVRSDVAYIYLMALGLGFRGKYHGVDDQGRLDSYKRQLYSFIYHQDPQLFEGGGKLCPESYVHVSTTSEGRRLHDFRPWFFAFGFVLLVLLFASYAMWYQSTAPLNKTLSQIEETHDRLVRRRL